jgi:hypothetical protein
MLNIDCDVATSQSRRLSEHYPIIERDINLNRPPGPHQPRASPSPETLWNHWMGLRCYDSHGEPFLRAQFMSAPSRSSCQGMKSPFAIPRLSRISSLAKKVLAKEHKIKCRCKLLDSFRSLSSAQRLPWKISYLVGERCERESG